MKLLQFINLLPLLIVHLCTLSPAVCYNTHTALSSIVFTEIPLQDDNVHSEYFFGRCAMTNKTLLKRLRFEYEDVKGVHILRHWFQFQEQPTCVYIRGVSSYADAVKYHAFKFNICFYRILYIYAGYEYDNTYFEWYIPVEMRRGITWELLFYVPWMGIEELPDAYKP